MTSNASTTSTSVETVESSTTTESEATPTATTSATIFYADNYTVQQCSMMHLQSALYISKNRVYKLWKSF